MKKREVLKARMLSFAIAYSLMVAFVSCSNEEVIQKGTDNDKDKNLRRGGDSHILRLFYQ